MRTYLDRFKTFLKKWETERYLEVLLVVFVLLLLVQGVRGLSSMIQAGSVLRSLEESNAPPPRRAAADGAEEYKAMLEKGTFGRAPGEQPLKVFGILGDSALLGATAESVKPYGIGAELPKGEKLVEIGPNSVVLEKDGERRTLTVFPEFAASKAKSSGRDEVLPVHGPAEASPSRDSIDATGK